MSSTNPTVVLFHYPYSPFARRITWYLALRGIQYSQCLQPPTMPRPNLARLGVKYRRIPVLSIGRDVYLDTRLILEKLEATHPSLPKLGASDPQSRALERLLASLTLDTGIFLSAARLLPKELPLLKDPKFIKDRRDYFPQQNPLEGGAGGGGESWADAVNRIRSAMELLETTLLADGREWILKTESPSLADVEAIWPFHWLVMMPVPALPASQVSAERYPLVYKWIARFDKAVRAAGQKAPKPNGLSGEEAAALILGSEFHEPEESLQVEESQGVETPRKGQVVKLWPTDTGSSGRDVGRLVGMNAREVVIAVDAEGAGAGVMVHAPRHGFKVRVEADL